MSARKNQLLTITPNTQSAQPLSLKLVIVGPVNRAGPVNMKLVASGGTGGYVYSLSTFFSLPGGLTGPNAATGVITGTPTAIGATLTQFEVADSSSTVARYQCTITVASRLVPHYYRPPIGEVGIPYTFTFAVTGATGAVTWTKPSGTIPAGLAALTTAGVLAGTPTVPVAISYFVVRATDAGSGDTLDILAAVDIRGVLVFTVPQVTVEIGTFGRIYPAAVVGAFYKLTPVITGGVPPYTATVTTSDVTPVFQDIGLRAVSATEISGTIIDVPGFGAGFGINLSIAITDAVGATSLVPGTVWLVPSPGGKIQAQKNGSPGGTDYGVTNRPGINLTEGGGTQIDFINNGAIATYTIGTLRARVATAAALPTNTYANGTGGAGATLTMNAVGVLTVDGKSVQFFDIVLVRSEASGFKNGLYQCTRTGTGAIAAILTRVTGMSTMEQYSGAVVTVGPEGTANPNTTWMCTVAPNPTVGTTAITFAGTGTTTATAPLASSGGIAPNITHQTSGAAAGTFKQLTVDVFGHVTGGVNAYNSIFSKNIIVVGGANYTGAADFGTYAGQDIVRITGAAGGTCNFNGFPAPAGAGVNSFVIVNASTSIIVLVTASGAEPTAANKYLMTANLSLGPDRCAVCWYDATTQRWRILSASP